MTSGGPAATPPPDLPPALDRRFEGVLLWSSRPSLAVRTARLLGDLAGAGAAVAWIAPLPAASLAERLGPLPPGAVPVLLADGCGSGRAELGSDGLHPLPSAPDGTDLEMLRTAAGAVADRLVRHGLAARLAPDAGSTAAVSVEFSPGVRLSSRADLKRLLFDHGLRGIVGLADAATEEARAAGVVDVRVAVERGRVVLATADAGDVALEVATDLWRRGVDIRSLLVLLDGTTGLPRRAAPVVVPDVREATFVLVDGSADRERPGIQTLTGGAERVRYVLSCQLRLRRHRALPARVAPAEWSLETCDDDGRPSAARDALFALADGWVGTGGPPLAGDRVDRVWTVANAVYDGEGPATHLLPGPVPFALGTAEPDRPVVRLLDLRTGLLHERSGSDGSAVESVRFLSLDRPTTAVVRASVPGGHRTGPPVHEPHTGVRVESGVLSGTRWVRVSGATGGIAAAGLQSRAVVAGTHGRDGPRRAVVDRVVALGTATDMLPGEAEVVDAASRAAAIGFDGLLASHRRAWARRWEDADILLEGDDALQRAIRFSLFHLMGSVADTGEAAVGARGLTGTGYSGHVFWDADAFVLPFLAATHPASARAMLEYRVRRLPVAIAAARALGRDGAHFPWESAHTGEDVTPTSARDRTGKVVPIRTGQLEEHIVAQVPLAADTYVEWSGDRKFERGPYRNLLVETARYWASRIRVEPDGTGHIYGVIGPDEYHEPVDDNACTNVLARWNLNRAAELFDEGSDGVSVAERSRWRDLAAGLYDGYDGDTGVYEQFAGFHRLEPLIIAEVAERRPIAADLLLGPDRTHGAQVIKQADVLMLHHLVPDQVVPGSLEPNLRFYERRTAHGSSLSPAIYASLLARARDFEPALDALRTAAFLDLDDLTGSSSAGLHLATMGGVWQALAFGFGGLRARSGRLHLDPVLPPTWSALEFRVRFRGAAVRIRKEHAHLSVTTDRPVDLVVSGKAVTGDRGTTRFRRHGPDWEEER
jgi:hypothetical protein